MHDGHVATATPLPYRLTVGRHTVWVYPVTSGRNGLCPVHESRLDQRETDETTTAPRGHLDIARRGTHGLFIRVQRRQGCDDHRLYAESQRRSPKRHRKD